MQFSAGQIAALLNGEVEGDAQASVSALAKIEEGHRGALTFLANPKYTEHIYSTEASVAIVGRDFKPERSLPQHLTLIRVDDAYSAFAKLLATYEQATSVKPGKEDPHFLDPSATIGKDVYIGAFVRIGPRVVIGDNVQIHANCTIGEDVHIGEGTNVHANVSIYPRTQIGRHCIIHGGAVIGADGFGFAPSDANDYKKVPQIGNVILEDHVEIGSNTSIDRATLGSTIIRKGVKLDNLIQVAHNVEIGEHTVIAAQTGIAGSTKIGRRCMIGGQVGIVGHLTIADEVKIAAQSGIGQSITEVGAIVQGSPAFPIGDYKRSYVMFRQLPKLKQKLDELASALAAMKDPIKKA